MESKAHLPLQYFHTLFGYRCWRRNVLVTTIKSWCRFFLSPTSYLLTLASGANIQKCHQHRNSVTNGDSPFKKIFGAIRVWLQWSRFTSFYWHQCAFSASTQFGDVWWCWWLKCYQHIEISTISIFVTKDSHQRHYSLDFILNCNSVPKVPCARSYCMIFFLGGDFIIQSRFHGLIILDQLKRNFWIYWQKLLKCNCSSDSTFCSWFMVFGRVF